MGLVVVIPIVLGIILMIRNIRRSIFDMLSAPLFISIVAVFFLGVKTNLESLAATNTPADRQVQEKYLEEIAYYHVIVIGLLIAVLILQLLSRSTRKVSPKKRL
jgi:hypothetical protein